jgi:hypothetical protein
LRESDTKSDTRYLKDTSGFDISAQQILCTASSTGNCNALYVAVDRPPLEVEVEVA